MPALSPHKEPACRKRISEMARRDTARPSCAWRATAPAHALLGVPAACVCHQSRSCRPEHDTPGARGELAQAARSAVDHTAREAERPSLTIPVGENSALPRSGHRPVPSKCQWIRLESRRRDGRYGRRGRDGPKPGNGRTLRHISDGTDAISVRVARLAGRLSSPTPGRRSREAPLPRCLGGCLAPARAACVLEPGAFAVVSIAESREICHRQQARCACR